MTEQPKPENLSDGVKSEQEAYLRAVEATMSEFFAQQRTLLTAISHDALPLLEAIESLSSGGKRLRALLSYWGWRVAGGDSILEGSAPAPIIRAGAALELFQSAALIHDDIIDRSDTRRGKPSVHKKFETQHIQNSWVGDTFNYGLTGGIIAGDLCLSWSEQMFSSIGEGALSGTEARNIFDTMRTEVMAGQYLDVLSEVIPAETPENALARAHRVIQYKSAKYSCEHPLVLGGALALTAIAHQDHPILGKYRAFGLPLGEGFQLRDDELGVFGEPSATGKPAGDDIREGKRTVLIALTTQNISAEDRRMLEGALGNPELTNQQISKIRELMIDSGTLEHVEELIAQKSEAVDTALHALPVSEPIRCALSAIAAKALHRKA